MTTTVKKSSQVENNNETNVDINGRIEYIDQSLRSVDMRLQAVEKRLSIKTFEPLRENSIPGPEIHGSGDDVQLREKLQEIDRTLATLEKTTQETHVNEFSSLKLQLTSIENRILKLENE